MHNGKLSATHTRNMYFSTASTVARTHLNVTLYVHCLSCYRQRSGQFCCFSLRFLVLEEVNGWKLKTVLKMNWTVTPEGGLVLLQVMGWNVRTFFFGWLK